MMNTIKGDLVQLANEGRFNVIVHGCNCFCTMGAGIAAQIANVFPEAEAVDKLTVRGDIAKLGSATIAPVRGKYDDALLVVNAYTQYNFASLDVPRVVDYNAVSKVFSTTVYNLACMNDNIRIGIPMIGAGLAGGDWGIIKSIIEEALDGFANPDLLTLVEYEG